MSASSPPFDGRNGSPSLKKRSNGNVGRWNRYICIVGDWPSGGVPMLALSMWNVSGVVSKKGSGPTFAPSSFWASTGSLVSNAPFAAVNEIGACASQSWKLLTKKKTWVAFCWRFVSFVASAVIWLVGSHVQVNVTPQGAPNAVDAASG